MVDERRKELAQKLVQEGRLIAKELAHQYQVTAETIRKDIAYLETQGLAHKVHGGAIYANDSRELPYHRTSTLNRKQKAAIARLAVSLVDGHVVMIDGGSTNLAIAKLLSLKDRLTIVTNSLTIPPVFSNAPGIELSLTGGHIRQISQDLVGYWAVRPISETTGDVCFIGANSLSHANGPTTSTTTEAEVKRAMLTSCKARYLVADSSKVGSISTYQFAAWNELTAVITDDGIDPSFVDRISVYTKVLVATATDETAMNP